MQRFSVHTRLQRKQRPSASGLCMSSLLVGVRTNFTHIKLVEDKTGCHRFACNVSWAWFLLWAGRAALHFYSNPPKTIPCVIWLQNLSDAGTIQVWGIDVCKPGPFSGFFTAVHQDTTSFTLQRQGLADRTREDNSVRPPPLLVRNQNGLGLSGTAASSQGQKQLQQKLS